MTKMSKSVYLLIMHGPKGFAGIFSKILWHVVFEVPFKKLKQLSPIPYFINCNLKNSQLVSLQENLTGCQKLLISNNCFFFTFGERKGLLGFWDNVGLGQEWLRNWLFLADILYAWFQRDLHAFSQKNMTCGFEVPFENKKQML